MRNGNYMDPRLLLALAGLLLIGLAFTVLSLYRESQRQQVHVTTVMERTRQIVKARADALFRTMEEDLMQEAHAVQIHSKIDTSLLLDRWRTLIATKWPVLGISMADGRGNEFTLQRADTGLVLRDRTVSTTRIISREQVVPVHPEVPIQAAPIYLPPLTDPRTEVWISKALENHRDTPVWSSARPTPDGLPGMRVSYRLPTRAGAPDLVLSFHVAVDRSTWLATNALQQRTVAYFLMTDDGSMLSRQATDHWSSPVIPEAVTSWKALQKRGQYPINVAGNEYWFQASAYELNGRSLRLATLVPADLETFHDRPERQTLMMMLLLLIMALGLCGWLWFGRQAEMDRFKRQARRSRTQELRLVKALGEREVLNREVHHRVKNNLQIVSSLLNLQATRLDEGPVRDEFLRGKLRIDTMALVHHKLYELRDLREVDLDLFIRGLMQALVQHYAPQSRTVSHEVQTHDIKADQDTAITLGLILCELAGNAYLHAFPYATGGHIDVDIRPVEGDLYRLLVKDNGQGLDRTNGTRNVQLGLEIVEALADQLDGSFHSSTGPGTTLEVLFRMPPYKPV